MESPLDVNIPAVIPVLGWGWLTLEILSFTIDALNATGAFSGGGASGGDAPIFLKRRKLPRRVPPAAHPAPVPQAQPQPQNLPRPFPFLPPIGLPRGPLGRPQGVPGSGLRPGQLPPHTGFPGLDNPFGGGVPAPAGSPVPLSPGSGSLGGVGGGIGSIVEGILGSGAVPVLP